MGLLKKLFPSKNQRVINKYKSRIDSINNLEIKLQESSDDMLRKKTADWKTQLSSISDNDQLAQELEKILPEAFAVVKNACRRLCGTEVNVRGNNIGWEMFPYDVQLIGGMALHNNSIAEMATGEGKTLVATLPVYLNALSGRGVHVVTVNDYLAKRDSEWMGAIYNSSAYLLDALFTI